MSFNDNGDFGMYSANIWALSALAGGRGTSAKRNSGYCKKTGTVQKHLTWI